MLFLRVTYVVSHFVQCVDIDQRAKTYYGAIWYTRYVSPSSCRNQSC